MKPPPPYQPCRPRALRPRTPEEQRVIAAALRSGERYAAVGPVAGTCGHRHLTPRSAARCVSDARPTVARYRKPGVGEWSAPAPGELAGRGESAFGRGLVFVVCALSLMAAWQVWF